MATAGGLEIHEELAHRPDSPRVTAPAGAAVADVDDIVPLERPRRQSKVKGRPLIAFAIVALLVAGVASALVRSNEGPSNPLAMVQAAASTTADAGTAQVSATIKTTSGPLANGVSVDGGFDFDNHRASLEVDPSKFGVSGVGKIEAIADYSSGFVMYMRFPAQFAQELGGKPWVKFDFATLMKQAGIDVDLGSLLQGQSNDPTQGLGMVRGADNVVKVGTEQIRGTGTTHYRLVVDLDKAIADKGAGQGCGSRHAAQCRVRAAARRFPER